MRMRCRDVYIRIERLPAYSPVAPDGGEHGRYGRDCMRGHGHEDARIPQAEVERRRLDAVVYREYLDADYTVPNTAPLVASDLTEPRWDQRIPGCVLYAEPGERLRVHVRNADTEPHALHMHGLAYGVDSDGAWPFGVAAPDGRRGDAICPGRQWCYVYDVTEDTIGCWPFHDHVMDIEAAVARGLFGGLVVRDPEAPEVDLEVPFFLHRLVGTRNAAGFDSGTMGPGGPPFAATFPTAGTYEYVCRFHPMQGRVRVNPTGPAAAAVTILDGGAARFEPAEVTIGVGGTVTWTHGGAVPHTVTEAAGAPIDTMSINGRAFVGNTPIVLGETGQRIRWYVFNLDLGERWHNFHPHGQRFSWAGRMADTASLGPAESFCVDTTVPPVVLVPPCCDDDGGCGCSHTCGCGADCACTKEKRCSEECRCGGCGCVKACTCGADCRCGKGNRCAKGCKCGPAARGKPGHGEQDDEAGHAKSRTACLRGDFLVHCHVEMHMMMGMAALVRAVQTVRLSERDIECLGFVPPEASAAYCRRLGHDHETHPGLEPAPEHGGRRGAHGRPAGHRRHVQLGFDDTCPDVSHHPCGHDAVGEWELLGDLDIFVVHAAVLHTGKVLLWSGTAEVDDPLESRLWDPATDARSTQFYAEDLFCAGHAFLPDGRLVVGGGAPIGSMRSTHIFDPGSELWTKVADMNEARWYPTLLTLPDGRILAASGSGASGVEIYDAAANSWQFVAGASRTFPELYPSLHLLPAGPIFYSRAGWATADTVDTASARLDLTGPLAGAWTPLGQLAFHDRQEGTAVLRIDATVSPPATEVVVIGGGVAGSPATRNPQTVETIDLTTPGPGTAWASPPLTMNQVRGNVNAVLLPDGTVLIVGGQRAGKWATDPDPVLEAEIFDPVTRTFTATPPMQFPRQYHSIAALLPDGRVLCAGGVDPPNPVERDQRQMEVFSPPYLARGPRPQITAAPGTAAYGAAITVTTPDAADITAVALIRPNSVTHHTDAGHRWIKVGFTPTTGAVEVTMPATATVAPPGYYMLFLLNGLAVPSEAAFLRLG